MASFEVSGESSILSYSTCTECKLQCVAVSLWQGLALFHLDFQEFGYPELIFCVVWFPMQLKVADFFSCNQADVLFLAKLNCPLFFPMSLHTFSVVRCCVHFTRHLVGSLEGCEVLTLHGQLATEAFTQHGPPISRLCQLSANVRTQRPGRCFPSHT